MREFKILWPRALSFRLLLILASALMLMPAFVPRANATLIDYFNFEDSTLGNPPDFTSDAPPGAVSNTITTNYNPANMTSTTGLALNVAAGDADPNLLGLGLSRTSPNNGTHFDIPLNSAQGIFQNMTLTFAYSNHGNGFATVTLAFSTNGGGTFTNGPSATMITGGTFLVTLAVPVAANNSPLLTLRLIFTNGTSNGADPQTVIDNIQINGTIVPEPTTIAGGVLGVLGLCWFQRRRLIYLARLPRLRRT
jgi:hypothetical protein